MVKRATPTVYLAGDSTMAENGGSSGTEGWGHYLQYSLDIPVVNEAIGGRSARSYSVEGRFSDIEDVLQSGDFVVIEFGHNDGGSLSSSDNGRTDCPGEGDETCESTYNGEAVTVHTYNWYLLEAARSFLDKGAQVIISSQTPNNPWESGSFAYSGSRFVGYASNVADTLASDDVAYVDHGQYTANIFESLGKDTVNSYFTLDHTHTQPEGADTVAKAFVKGLACGGSALASHVTNATDSIEGSCI
ncbi:carbohydrate esterase family 12 protein [Aplosporella prunicola CBS 121167]|uniref:Carbohydrate esterase family 12 protein n=1 Tax=Aplosporella prunicola CBS 121167 TaxID=1176127 RepID=A0A6A6B8S2_9PEZI|nr:carbohydrate esterase family 12 protein [Aplosporella prunicola CBS 121167]KAF2139763.1 carbohydrate esterase family 12 protein [Aplosporella prunicola CBS 121167]